MNLLDLAALAVPAEMREDALPSGITLIAPALSENLLLACAAQFHRAIAKTLGATSFPLPPFDGWTPPAATDDVTLAVVGAHLNGMPLNHQLTSRGARLLDTCRTAAMYRLFALAGTEPPKPGLVRVADGQGRSIELELWTLSRQAFGAFVAEVPPPLAIGNLTLEDGRQVKGFVCEHYAVQSARDVSSFGGWRKYVQAEFKAALAVTPL